MIPEPLHPAVVHFPIVFTLLLPAVAVVSLLAIRRGVEARKAWLPTMALAAALSASAWVAVETGEAEEDVVEAVVPESAIHEHEEAAEVFLYGSVGVLLLVATGLLQSGIGRVGRVAGTVAAVLLTLAGYQVGRLGGELVYEHGAAAAYSTNLVESGGDGPTVEEPGS